MKGGDENVRRSAAGTLGRIGDAGAVEALKEALKDEDGFVRDLATRVLKEIKAKQKSTNMEAEKDSSDE